MKKQAFFWVALVALVLGWVAPGGAVEVEVILQKARTGSPESRVAALRELGGRRDARAVSSLVSILKNDSEWEVRLAAEEALVGIGSASVEPLIHILKEEKECFIRRRAIRALKELKETCDPRAFRDAATKDKDCFVRKIAARALGEIKDRVASDFLDDAMNEKNLEVISAAYGYYIRKGNPETEDVLMEALWANCTDKKMVFHFAHCGNRRLEEAAREVARKGGYAIVRDPAGAEWGKR